MKSSAEGNEIKFRVAFENSNIGIALVGINGDIVKINRKMCSIFGYSEDELLKMKMDDLSLEDDKNIKSLYSEREKKVRRTFI